ncbi:glucoamylase family protein [Flammeovirgaceae bacterium SG7u.111]|nr:glucoamylase family protein [Flammeovirgaceae bacterium SG7u.132]WPO36005.1 glucoamylase family protein [Flammeovirgaceae bacterium SG7u.111]
MSLRKLVLLFIISISLWACKKDEPQVGSFELKQAFLGTSELVLLGNNEEMPVDRNISLIFSTPVNQASAQNAITLSAGAQNTTIDFNFLSEDKNVVLIPSGVLLNNTVYTITISPQLQGANGESFAATTISFKTIAEELKLLSANLNGDEITGTNNILDAPMDFQITFGFSVPLDQNSVEEAMKLSGPDAPALTLTFSEEDKTVSFKGNNLLNYLSKYQFQLSDKLKGLEGEPFEGYDLAFYTEVDTTPKFPIITEEELLTKVQQQTFRYFWDFAHPTSGLIRERNTSNQTVTSGGSGFGLMTILVGIERGFISKAEGLERLTTMVDFLEKADRFHGAWSHWLDGATGKAVPFSPDDDGGDLVETSFVVMGLITVRQYLDEQVAEEKLLIEKINQLCEEVEWDWYTQGENSLTWHWSPNVGWKMNHTIRGWNEALITYVLAASSATHSISTEVYEQGWKGGNMENGKDFFGIKLPLGPDYGGPLFFEQYSFLGLDPRNLKDPKTDYWEQAVNHSLINQAYCSQNPKKYAGYSENSWGLTASDGNNGYSAHSPTNDLGVITPTAALSSFPFTPAESTKALNHFYYHLGDRLWGEYGFYDAFNASENWYASSNIAIDQAPIILMIENHRTGLLWNLFMSAPEVQNGLGKLGFTY